MTIKWRNPYDADENYAMDIATAITITDPSMTEQAPADEQDINIIMKRFGVKDGSKLPYWQDPQALFGDFSNMPKDAQEAAEMLRLANTEFLKLPADVRRRFDSGEHMMQWLSDPTNVDDAIKLGLLEVQPKAPATLDSLQDAVVSINTSRDKEPLVQTPKPETK